MPKESLKHLQAMDAAGGGTPQAETPTDAQSPSYHSRTIREMVIMKKSEETINNEVNRIQKEISRKPL